MVYLTEYVNKQRRHVVFQFFAKIHQKLQVVTEISVIDFESMRLAMIKLLKLALD